MNSKKLIASVIALAMAVTVVPGLSQAATAEELAAQIQQLQAQLAGLQGQLGGTTASGVANANIAACTGVTFTRNLTLGSTGTDVKCLQALLNSDAATAVAATGVGSAGNETTTFGGLTKAAVIKFQDKYAAEVLTPVGLTAGTGFVGAATRAKLNAMLAGGATTGGTTTGGTTTGTLPAGCTSTTGYSSTTGVKCDSTATTTTTGGAEGTITVTVNPSPADNTKVYEGDQKVAIYGLKIKASGSDMDVQRLTLKFDKQPYTYFTNLYVYDGDTQVATSALSSSTVSKVGTSDYEITLTGFASKVLVTKDTTKVLTVKVDVQSGITSGAFGTSSTSTLGTRSCTGVASTSACIAILAASGSSNSVTTVRAVDQAGLNQYSGDATGRLVSVNASQSANATLTVSVNSATPKARNIVADSSQNVTGVTVLTFDVKATKDNLLINSIDHVQFASGAVIPDTSVAYATTGTASAGPTYKVPSTVYLVDDAGTVIGTASPATAGNLAEASFTDLSYTIAKDTTKTFSIKVDDTVSAANTTTHISTDDAKRYEAALFGTNISADKSNGLSMTGTGTAIGYDAIVFGEGPVFTLSGISTTATQAAYLGSTSTLSATFNVQVAATTGDVYIPASSVGAFSVDFGVNSVAQNTPASVNVTYTQPSGTTAATCTVASAGACYRITSGTTATFAVGATYTRTSTAGAFYDLRLDTVTWKHTAAGANVVSSYMTDQTEWISQQIALN